MKDLLNIAKILESIKKIADNTAIWVKSLVFIIVVGIVFAVGAISFSKTKVKAQDCSSYIDENRLLINALIEIKKDIKEVSAINYIMDYPNEFRVMYASYDTVPKKPTQKDMKLDSVLSKIDSILLKHKKLEQKRKIKQ